MIYDCFPFFNELDLLEVRLNELDRVVDRFVLVESPRTFSGQPKPLYFARHARRYRQWRSRIRHVVVDDMPDTHDPWVRDHHQRNSIARGLTDCGPDDVILVSDADEIPRASQVAEHRSAPGVTVFELKLSYYFLNNRARDPWLGTRMCSYSTYRSLRGAQLVRAALGLTVRDGGWHFSFMGGAGSIRRKLQAYAHQEYNTPEHAAAAQLGHALISNADLFGRDLGWAITPDADLPQFVLDHKVRFADWICEGPLSEVWSGAESGLSSMATLCRRVAGLEGDVVLLGCSDVQSAIALANECHPQSLLAVDPWAEDAAERRDTTSQGRRCPSGLLSFLRSVRLLTAGNVQPIVMELDQFLRPHPVPVKLCHLGWEANARTLRSRIACVLPRVVSGGIISGGGCRAHSLPLQETLDDLLPGRVSMDSLWFWIRNQDRAGKAG